MTLPCALLSHVIGQGCAWHMACLARAEYNPCSTAHNISEHSKWFEFGGEPSEKTDISRSRPEICPRLRS